jgi:hypothetical protein
MDQNKTTQTSETPSQNVSQPPVQKLSSEESYSKDYELFSKKPNHKLLIIILSVVFLLISVIAGLFFFGVIRF